MEINEFEQITKLVGKIDSQNQQNIGARKSLLRELKDKYDMKSLETAEKFITGIEKELKQLKEEIDVNFQELKNELEKIGVL